MTCYYKNTFYENNGLFQNKNKCSTKSGLFPDLSFANLSNIRLSRNQPDSSVCFCVQALVVWGAGGLRERPLCTRERRRVEKTNVILVFLCEWVCHGKVLGISHVARPHLRTSGLVEWLVLGRNVGAQDVLGSGFEDRKSWAVSGYPSSTMHFKGLRRVGAGKI